MTASGRPPVPAGFASAMRAILIGRTLCGLAALAFGVWIGGAWGAAVAAVAGVYLAANAYWYRRTAGGGRGRNSA